ncbi:MAG: hypothetical protein M1816_005468 [Peltula sp. TS41687]|nr:MAG: hypothetical protein M1816_005468 [Peltula sp. TS41687]
MSALQRLLERGKWKRKVGGEAGNVPQDRNAESAKVSKQKAGSDHGLKVLYQPLDEPTAVVDIVFVHGLRGSSDNTWLDEASGIHWPTDLLSQDLNDARILAFAYDANVVNLWNPVSQNRVSNHAENLLGALARQRERTGSEDRKILFVVHSLGGLVTQNALYLSRGNAESHIQQVGDCTVAIAFLGTPNFGANLASWAKFGTNIAAMVKHANADISSVLKPGSEMLMNIQSGFHHMLRLRKQEGAEIAITCFYEELPVRIIGEVVPKHSAIIPGYSSYGIHANHMDMARFSSSEDDGYKAVCGEIRRWVKRLRPMERGSDLNSEPWTKISVALSSEEIKCIQSLYTSDYASHRRRNPDRIEGTCEWFLRHDKYQNWRQEEESSLLWVSADPGCGKSVLASFLVQELSSEESQSTVPGTVCYFFFKEDSDKQRSATYALCALLHQLLTARLCLIKHATIEFQNKESKVVEEFGTLWDIFTSCLADPACGNVICVVDGLEECEASGRDFLIKSLVRFYKEVEGQKTDRNSLKLIITSRPYDSVERLFRKHPIIRLKAEDETGAISLDIERVVKAKVDELGAHWGLSARVLTRLRDDLIQSADRTFLWVSLILQLLEESARTSEATFQKILCQPPIGLDAVYENMLRRSPDPNEARKILHIVVAAVRPLTLKEMNIALAIRLNHKSIEELQPHLESAIDQVVKSLCGPFIRVIDSKIYLVHQTAKGFLRNESTTVVPHPGMWKHSLCPVESNLVLAEICVAYLRSDVFESHPMVVKDNNQPLIASVNSQYMARHGFLDYSAKHWAVHFRESRVGREAPLSTFVLDLYKTQSQRFHTWFQVYSSSISHYEKAYSRYNSDLAVAFYLGHEVSVTLLLEKTVQLDAQDQFSRTALMWAARNGYEVIAKLLLEKGAAPDHQDAWGRTSLSLAADNGHEAVVKLLLGQGVKVDSKSADGQTPLFWAAIRGHKTVMRLLLEQGAEVDSKDRAGRTPLFKAAWSNQETVVKLLLEKGAKMDIQDKRDETPLHVAAVEGREAVVAILLERGAKIDPRNEDARTPLFFAAMRGHEAVVKLLLEKGAELDLRDKWDRTPLHVAAVEGREAVVAILLERGAKIDPRDVVGQTPLICAAKGDHEAVVKLLLEKGAELDLRDIWDQTPLHLAAAAACKAVVAILLERGAKIDPRNEDAWTPLFFAAERGHEAVVKLLLEKGAELDLRDKGDQTPLHVAAVEGREAVVAILLERGAKIDPGNEDAQTPLFFAAMRGHEAVVKLLLEKGAELDLRNKWDQTPLHVAAAAGCKAVVAILLEGGAKIDSRNEDAWTPLFFAAERGHEAVVKLLLEKGAELDLRDKWDRTPLHVAAVEGREAVVAILLERGAKIDPRDEDARTPLFCAAWKGNETVVKLLLK